MLAEAQLVVEPNSPNAAVHADDEPEMEWVMTAWTSLALGAWSQG
jgi:hypothetical protein